MTVVEGRPASRPSVSSDVELVGEFQDSGFKRAPYIVRRADGQVIQLPEILYRLAEALDGRKDWPEVAEEVSHAVKRGLGPEDAEALAEAKLRPLGILAEPDGSTPEVAKADPLLALKFRTKVVPARATRAITSLFSPLFLLPVVVLAVAASLALDVWTLGVHGIAPGVRHMLSQPAIMVVIFGGIVLATAFHEIGHATACRFGGAEPGVMGV